MAPTGVNQTDVDAAWKSFQTSQKVTGTAANTFNNLGNFINTYKAVPSVFIEPFGLGGTVEIAGNTIDFANYFKTRMITYRQKWAALKSSTSKVDKETGLQKRSDRTVMPMEYAWILAQKEWGTLKASPQQ